MKVSTTRSLGVGGIALSDGICSGIENASMAHYLAGTLFGWHNIWVAFYLSFHQVEFCLYDYGDGVSTTLQWWKVSAHVCYRTLESTYACALWFCKLGKSESLLLHSQSNRDRISNFSMDTVSALFGLDLVARQAYSSQYLSNSTEITTKAETAMLSTCGKQTQAGWVQGLILKDNQLSLRVLKASRQASLSVFLCFCRT